MRRLWRKVWFRLVVYAVALMAAGFVAVAFTAPRPPHDGGHLPTLRGVRTVSHVDPLLSRLATLYGGKRVEVRCWSPRDWERLGNEIAAYTDGHFRPGIWSAYESTNHRRVNVGPPVCAALERLGYSDSPPGSYDEAWWFAWSVWVLLDVTEQARGFDIRTADCFALQQITPLSRALGLERVTARDLGALFWNGIYPKGPAARQSAECRPGGKLDLRPRDPRWP